MNKLYVHYDWQSTEVLSHVIVTMFPCTYIVPDNTWM